MKHFIVSATIITAVIFAVVYGRKQTPAVTTNGLVYCAPSFDPATIKAENAPVFEGLGNHHYKVTTRSEKAQQYFNQGLTLLYAFNHGEAGRSFKAAIALDSTCAMSWWGLAMVLGPNYNAALNPASLVEINEAVNNAMLFAKNTAPNEKALIAALRLRFPRTATSDLSPYSRAYAASMQKAQAQFPDDIDIAALYADALMNEHPWDLWMKDGTSRPWTPAIVTQLENLLVTAPLHAGANHMYIHAMEASGKPEAALASADRLRDLLPAAGHLVHMPAHIYIRTGDYSKGILTTEAAAVADSNYVVQCKVQGTYPLLYYPHNIHFLAACAYLAGNSKKALEAARSVSAHADSRYLDENVTLQHYYIIPFYVMVQTGKWQEILNLPEPAKTQLYPRAIWHYARGMAYTALDKINEAQNELASLKVIGKNEQLNEQLIWETNTAGQIVQIATSILTGELAADAGNFDLAEKSLRHAIGIEDGLMYQEPPDWFFSARHTLGHILLLAKKFPEAQKVYEEDLTKYPENGWALMGLYQSLVGQGKTSDAGAAKTRFDKAWTDADIEINSSRYY
ncbi:MAG: hypothetical protein EOO04_04680 [Chitinophagaceae bacterium]|nr:MAG: hypothetical protein EOO04_04680 [Chitinophagaceae bacterium]